MFTLLAGMTSLLFKMERLRLLVYFNTCEGYVSLTERQKFLWLSLEDFYNLISFYLQSQHQEWPGWLSNDASITPLCWDSEPIYELADANGDATHISMSELNDLAAAYPVINYLVLILQRSPCHDDVYFHSALDSLTTFMFRAGNLFITFSANEGFDMFDLRGARKLHLSALRESQGASPLEPPSASKRYANTNTLLPFGKRSIFIHDNNNNALRPTEPNVFSFDLEDWHYLVLCIQLYSVVCKFVSRCLTAPWSGVLD